MKKLLVILIILFAAGNLRAQSPIDTLSYSRKVFHSSVYINGGLKTNKIIASIYRNENLYEAERLLCRHQVMLPIGAATTAAGIYLGVDALVGTKRVENINGKDYTYYKRPIFQVLGGLGLIAAGVTIMEFGNDAKIKSTSVYNKHLADKQLNAKLGFTKSGHLGLMFDF